MNEFSIFKQTKITIEENKSEKIVYLLFIYYT